MSMRERELAEQLAQTERDSERFCQRIAQLEKACKAVIDVGTCDPDFNRKWAIDKLTTALSPASAEEDKT